MNRLILMITLLFVLIIPQASQAVVTYPDPYRQTMWNSFTDKMHTLGQNPQQAKTTIKRLHTARTHARWRSINQAKQQAWINSNKPQ